MMKFAKHVGEKKENVGYGGTTYSLPRTLKEAWPRGQTRFDSLASVGLRLLALWVVFASDIRFMINH